MRPFSTYFSAPKRSLAASLALGAVVATSALHLTAPAASQTPCVDTDQLLDTIDTIDGTTKFLFLGGHGAFFPEEVFYDGRNLTKDKNQAYLILGKGGEEIERWTMLVEKSIGVFCRYRTVGPSASYAFTEAGDYSLSVAIDDRTLTSVPFTVQIKSSGDPFDPKTMALTDSALMHWAQLRVRDPKSSGANVEVVFRLRGDEFAVPPKENIEVFIENQGQKVYRAGTLSAAGLPKGGNWGKFTKSVQYRKEQGSGVVKVGDFTKRDGDYRIVLREGGKALKAFPFVIEGGKVTAHRRSAFGYEPATDFLLPRVVGGRESGQFVDVTWIEPAAEGAPEPVAATVAGPSAASRAAWKPVPPAPDRPTEIRLTDIAARVDAHIAAGDGIIAYGTGAGSGVAYLRAGEDTETTFAGGSDASSKVFFVCGKKLVLLKGKGLVIHDTETGASFEVPESTITLPRTPSEITKGRHVDADGMLVAVICNPSKVTDGRTIKVLDLTGPEPSVIALGFPEAEPNELVSIAVDAAGGQVVVGNDRQNALFAAPIAEGAPFKKFDLSAHDGLPKDCAPIVRGGFAAVFDTTGTRKLRLVNLESGAIQAVAPLAKAQQWFAFDGQRIALAGNTSYGSSYAVLVGTKDGGVAAPAGSGDSVKGGKNGYGQRVALSESGIVFVSGEGKSGISNDEVLFTTEGSGWHSVLHGGAPLKAVDVTAGRHLMAFKTGKSRDARIGYVLLGAKSEAGNVGE